MQNVFIIEETKETIVDFFKRNFESIIDFIFFYCKMTQYNTLNVKSRIKNGTEVTLKLSNVVGDSNDDTNFLSKLLLTNTQVQRLCKDFANGSSTNMKLSKT